MKKITDRNYDVILSAAKNIFESPDSICFTLQQVYFSYLSSWYMPRFETVTKNKINLFKEKFLMWQNKEIPNCSWMDTSSKKFIFIKAYFHDDDFTWDSLDEYVYNYIYYNVQEIKCNTYKEHLLENYLQKLNDDDNFIW